MTIISQTALLPYSAEAMFALVNDIAAYPLFMHGCVSAQIISADAQAITARLELGKAGLCYSFTTRNVLKAPTDIHMTLVEGPFKNFSAQWRFVQLTDTDCKTCLDMQFEFKLGLLDVALRTLFEATSKDLVNAVCKRAEYLYGKH